MGTLLCFALSSCATKVKVREEWSPAHGKPIPLGEAKRVWSEMRQGHAPGEADLKLYNDSVRDVVVQVAKNWESGAGPSALRTSEGEVGLRVSAPEVPGVATAQEIVPADYVKVRRGLDAESSVKGVGAPLIVRQPRRGDGCAIPETGLWVPVTALLNLDDPRSPVLELHDPTKRGRIPMGGTEFPLSANYTAAFARDFQDRQFQFENLSGLLRFEQFADRMGLYRVTPGHADKEICIFVHGINSSPSTWDEVLNRLYGDPDIRDRYEFWTFGYPTGAPIPYMAAEFRRAILEMLENRRQKGLGAPRITVVGHSMGGLLAKAATFSGGDAEWSKLFSVPLDQLDLSEADKTLLRRMFYFEPIPEIGRVVLCAVPHRGSKIAANPGIKIIGGLVEVPTQLVVLTSDILTKSADALTPAGLEFTRKSFNSIDQLASEAWTTAEFLNKPLNPAVAYHSIIGNNRIASVPVEKSGDGVVPYSSSHIDGVESELVVRPSGHGVHRKGESIEEMARILKLPAAVKGKR
ncbi:MAG TPA: alpha/beta hydrolase [Bacteroidia bacterium]|nr:alpha/beta hydrolase [Bacteroidia bacterium]